MRPTLVTRPLADHQLPLDPVSGAGLCSGAGVFPKKQRSGLPSFGVARKRSHKTNWNHSRAQGDGYSSRRSADQHRFLQDKSIQLFSGIVPRAFPFGWALWPDYLSHDAARHLMRRDSIASWEMWSDQKSWPIKENGGNMPFPKGNVSEWGNTL